VLVVAGILCALACSPDCKHRLFATIWSLLSPQADAATSARKSELFANVRGCVVEIGPGVGVNVAYLPRDNIQQLTLAEPNTFMHKELNAAARRAGYHDSQFSVTSAVGSELALPAASQDVIICTLVLCSAVSSEAILREAHRVLRRGGRFIFLEHVVAPPTRPLRGALQRLVMATGLWSVLGDGCELTRDTGALMRRAATGLIRGAAGWTLDMREVDMPGCGAMALLAGSQIEGVLTKV
jgi:SAM-dependent methyltransferase